MDNKLNMREFLSLKEKYESITLEEVEKEFDTISENPLVDRCGKQVAKKLTGCGDMSTCTLCQATISIMDDGLVDCRKCVWVRMTHWNCYGNPNEETYYKIIRSQTPKALFDAFKARAKRMEEVLNERKV